MVILDDLNNRGYWGWNSTLVGKLYSGKYNHSVSCLRSCPGNADKEQFDCSGYVFYRQMNKKEIRPLRHCRAFTG